MGVKGLSDSVSGVTKRTTQTAPNFFGTDSSFERLLIVFERIAQAVRTASHPVRTADEQLTNGSPFQNGKP